MRSSLSIASRDLFRTVGSPMRTEVVGPILIRPPVPRQSCGDHQSRSDCWPSYYLSVQRASGTSIRPGNSHEREAVIIRPSGGRA